MVPQFARVGASLWVQQAVNRDFLHFSQTCTHVTLGRLCAVDAGGETIILFVSSESGSQESLGICTKRNGLMPHRI